MQQTLASLALPPLQGQAPPPLAGRITGKVFQLDTNDLGLESASFAFDRDGCLFTLKDSQHRVSHHLRQRTLAARRDRPARHAAQAHLRRRASEGDEIQGRSLRRLGGLRTPSR